MNTNLGGPVAKRKFQAVNIRGLPTILVRRWRRALAQDGQSMQEWFILRAAETADHVEGRKEGMRTTTGQQKKGKRTP